MNLFQRIGRALRSAPEVPPVSKRVSYREAWFPDTVKPAPKVSDAEFQDWSKRAMAKLCEAAPRKWEPISTQRTLKAISVCALLAKSPEKPHLMRAWSNTPSGTVWGWVCASDGGRYGIADTPQGAMAMWASSYAPCNSASGREINAAQWAIVNRSRLARGEWDGVL